MELSSYCVSLTSQHLCYSSDTTDKILTRLDSSIFLSLSIVSSITHLINIMASICLDFFFFQTFD